MASHDRDGSLLKKKQAQWEKERIENEIQGWYPFGSPGGGNPNKKHESLNYSPSTSKYEKTDSLDEKKSESTGGSYRNLQQQQETSDNNNMSTAHINNFHQLPCPAEVYMGENMASRSNATFQHDPSTMTNIPQSMYPPWPYPPLPYGYNMLPPGVVPIPINIMKDRNNEAYLPTPQFMPGYCYTSNGFPSHRTEEGTCGQPSTDRRAEAPVVDEQTPNTSSDRPNDSRLSTSLSGCTSGPDSRLSSADRRVHNRKGSVVMTDEEIEEQIRQRRLTEQQEERRNEELARKAQEEQRQLEQREREQQEKSLREEEEHRKAIAQREAQLSEAIEKAKREAELMRKARLFKHVIEGSDRSPEVEQRLLGVDSRTGDRVLNEIKHLERHKKLEWESMDYSFGRKSRKSSENAEQSPRSRSSPSKSRSQMTGQQQGEEPCRLQRERSTLTKNSLILNTSNDLQAFPSSRGVCHTPLTRAGVVRSSLPVNRRTPSGVIKPAKRHSEQSTQPEMQNNTKHDVDLTGLNVQQENHLKSVPVNAGGSRIPVLTQASGKSQSTNAPFERSSIQSRPLRPKKPGHNYSIDSFENPSVPSSRPRTSNILKALDDAMNPLLNPIATRKMRPSNKSPVNMTDTTGSLDSQDGTTSGSDCHTSPHESPVPSIMIESECDTRPYELNSPLTTKTLPTFHTPTRSRSALGSPSSYLNYSSPLRTAIFKQKVTEKGCAVHDEDCLSPDVRRKAETSLSRHSSVSSLRGSVLNLRGSLSNLSQNGEDSAALGKFKSLNPVYRSYNAKKSNDRHKATMDRLNQLREKLKSKENLVDSRPAMSVAVSP